MFRPATIKDIAKALGFSTSTVSRALRDGYEISEKTKNIVKEYAQKIEYKSNPIALSLKGRRSYSIGVVVCEVANSFFSQAINGIESIAYNKGYRVIISQSHDLYEREVINTKHLANSSVDGLIISMSAETTDFTHLTKLHEKGLPIVFFDRVIDEIKTHKVIANNFDGAFAATELLIKNGHSRIAHLANATHLSITKERMDGYKAALSKHLIDFNPTLVEHCQHGGMIYDEVENAVKNILNKASGVDAIFVSSDRLSIGCLTALKKLHSDADCLPVAGFSNSDVVELLKPSLSYVRQPALEMGRLATELLIDLIEAKYPVTEFETKVLEIELFVNDHALGSRR
ncbi:MAG: LacI family DNA-binding transcriptional regulator [Bacteroidota bacterium]